MDNSACNSAQSGFEWTVLTAVVLGSTVYGIDCLDIEADEPATVEAQWFAAESSAVAERQRMNAPETEVSAANSDYMDSDDDFIVDSDDDSKDSSGLEDNSLDDITILEEPTLNAHDIPRSTLISPPYFELMVHRYFLF